VGGDRPPVFAPALSPCGRQWFWHSTSSKLFAWVKCKTHP